jgi:hypothetical protein
MTSAHPVLDEVLVRRVHSEFLEMPGLRLTCQQAQRLWGLDGRTCVALLEFLVDGKFLCQLNDGMYMRPTDVHAHPRRRMVKATVADTPRTTEAV